MKDWRGFGVLFQLSWAIASSVLVPLLLGIFLDRAFSTSPLFLLVGVAFGIVAGTVGTVRIAGRAVEEIGNRGMADVHNAQRKEDKA